LSQEALAVKVQCSQQTISAYESGRILPRSIGVVALAAALGVEASKLCRADRRKAS
jgi:transcriptional regulator with XRE-family HTH domain